MAIITSKANIMDVAVTDGIRDILDIRATRMFAYDIIRQAVVKLYGANFDVLSESPFATTYRFYPKMYKDESIGYIITCCIWHDLYRTNSIDLASQLQFDEYGFEQELKSVRNTPDLARKINELAKCYKQDAEAKAKQQEIKLKSWQHKSCERVTNAIAKFFGCCVDKLCWVGKSIGNVFILLGAGITYTFYKLGWLGKQMWISIAYLWMLIVAKKKGACPYFVFEDKPAPTPPPSTPPQNDPRHFGVVIP